jgi:hypothetical protein
MINVFIDNLADMAFRLAIALIVFSIAFLGCSVLSARDIGRQYPFIHKVVTLLYLACLAVTGSLFFILMLLFITLIPVK